MCNDEGKREREADRVTDRSREKKKTDNRENNKRSVGRTINETILVFYPHNSTKEAETSEKIQPNHSKNQNTYFINSDSLKPKTSKSCLFSTLLDALINKYLSSSYLLILKIKKT